MMPEKKKVIMPKKKKRGGCSGSSDFDIVISGSGTTAHGPWGTDNDKDEGDNKGSSSDIEKSRS